MEINDYVSNYVEHMNLDIDCKKKTICFGYDNWIIGGVEKVLLTIMENMVDEYNIFLMLPKLKEERKGFTIPDFVHLVYVDSTNYPNDELYAKFCEILKVDLFIGSANLNCEHLTIYKKLKSLGIKSIMLNHQFWLFPCRNEILFSKEIEYRNNNLQYPDVVVCLTNVSAKLCSANLGREVCIMPNPNTFIIDESIGYEQREDMIVTVGRFDDKYKRLDKILNIYSEVYQRNKKIKLTVVGLVDYKETFGKELKQELKDLEIPEDHVIFTGAQEDVTKFYKKQKHFCLHQSQKALVWF